MQSNTIKFNLMKIVYNLDRESKISLFSEWDNIIKKSTSEDYIGLIKESKLHDPETSEHLVSIIDLLDKFLKVDDDISFKNVCLFIHPMMSGSKKITLRPYRIISLINRLYNLSKRFEKEYGSLKKITPELRELKEEFKENTRKIKERLMSFDNEFVTKKREPVASPEFSQDNKIENQIKIRMKKSPVRTSSKISDESVAKTIEKTVFALKECSRKMAITVLSQTTYGYGEEFDLEIKKEILGKLLDDKLSN